MAIVDGLECLVGAWMWCWGRDWLVARGWPAGAAPAAKAPVRLVRCRIFLLLWACLRGPLTASSWTCRLPTGLWLGGFGCISCGPSLWRRRRLAGSVIASCCWLCWCGAPLPLWLPEDVYLYSAVRL